MRATLLRVLALLSVVALPLAASPEERLELHPFASVSLGLGMAQDNAAVSALSLVTANLKGVAAFGPVAGVSAGLDTRYGALFAGARVGYQRSWVKQTLDLSIASGGSLHAEGSLDESLLLLARLGWAFSSVPVYVTGGWTWSWASSSISVSVPNLPSASDTLRQDGGVVGLGAQPAIGGNWFLELEYLLLLYRQVHLPTVLDPLVNVQVKSINTSFTLGVGYRFL